MQSLNLSWKWYWGIWGLMGLYMTTWDMALYPSSPVLRLLTMNLLQNGAWGLLGLFLIWLAHSHPIESFTWTGWRVWCLHLLASVVVAALGLLVAYLISLLVQSNEWKTLDWAMIRRALPRFFRAYFHTNLLFMWAVVGAFHGLRLYRKYKTREVEAARLEARFAEAQNLALRMQLQPHFLFNTLNSISALVHSSPEGADEMIGRLGDFLRKTLDAPPDQFVPLGRELAFIQDYLAIEQIRFQDRLQVVIQIPEALMNLPVPCFILQPLVENALKHGLSDRPQGGTLHLGAAFESGKLVLEIRDDGEGYLPGREGVGLANVRSRLDLLYKGRHRLEIKGSRGHGTQVTLRLPIDVDEVTGADAMVAP
ncbi:sensor histidine kinase [Geothrix sp. PMB-07]|uniref:sensor histidine kinase n=1 Tax=Geothrix sp. PMB-07 TaxID=3068640 RepID=UPI00274165D1|nr:histidine kinase [Geothrix sp. PMB-07]WLT33085.1 histidine kinase [Geothrix sp. PMB-07]